MPKIVIMPSILAADMGRHKKFVSSGSCVYFDAYC